MVVDEWNKLEEFFLEKPVHKANTLLKHSKEK